jgi:hypothetical protein
VETRKKNIGCIGHIRLPVTREELLLQFSHHENEELAELVFVPKEKLFTFLENQETSQ